MPPQLLRVIGIVCLVSNLGIGIWFASTDASMTQRVFMMGLLGLLVTVGLLCLATASQLTMRARRAGAAEVLAAEGLAAEGLTAEGRALGQAPTSSAEPE